MERRNIKLMLKDYFTFTTGERTGIIILMILIILSIGFRVYFSKKNINKTETASLIKNISKIEADSVKNKVELKKTNNNEKINYKDYSKNYTIVDLNTCDTSDLEKLPGIGQILSRRIIKYRNLLGGYYSKDQLFEVFGITVENYNSFQAYLKIDTLKIKKISINHADFKEINSHPYITFDQTKAIFKTKRKLGKLTNDNFMLCNAFDSIQLKKVLVYIKFN